MYLFIFENQDEQKVGIVIFGFFNIYFIIYSVFSIHSKYYLILIIVISISYY